MIDTRAVKIGQVVTSLAGRDKGRPFIVLEIVDSVFVKVVDGDLRRVDNPKLKKIKHLNVSGKVVKEIEALQISGAKLTNDKIRKYLERIAKNAEQTIGGA